MTPTKEHEHDIAAIGHALRREALDRGWCGEYDVFVDQLNLVLNVKLPDRSPPSSAFKAWRERMGNTVWPKGWIDQWFHHIAPKAMGLHALGKKTTLTPFEAERLVDMMDRRIDAGHPVVVSDSQCEQGRNWLVRYGRKQGMPDLDYAAITHFTFVGAEVHDNGHGWPSSAPIYVAHWADGSTLRYSNNSWQSGNKHIEFTHTPARGIA